MKIVPTEISYQNCWDSTLQNQVKIWSVWKNMFLEWKKARKIFISLLVKTKLLLLTLHSLNLWKKEELKLYIWLIQLMNTWSNNWKNSMARNSRTVLKKDLIWKKLKMKRRNLKNRRPLSNLYALWSKKY